MQCAWLAKIYPEKELVVHDEPQRAVPCRCGVRGGGWRCCLGARPAPGEPLTRLHEPSAGQRLRRDYCHTDKGADPLCKTHCSLSPGKLDASYCLVQRATVCASWCSHQRPGGLNWGKRLKGKAKAFTCVRCFQA